MADIYHTGVYVIYLSRKRMLFLKNLSGGIQLTSRIETKQVLGLDGGTPLIFWGVCLQRLAFYRIYF